MGEDASQTRREIEATRQQMTDRINQLESAVRATLDWQARVRSKPWLYVGLALAAGFLVAGGPKRGMTHAYRAIRRTARPALVLPALPEPAHSQPKNERAPRAPLQERLALRAAEAAATAVAAILTNRLLREMSGQDATKQ